MKGLHPARRLLAMLAAALLLLPHPALADLIPTAPVPESSPSASLRASPAAAGEQLRRLGLTPEEVETRLAQMTPDDVAQVVESPEQLQLAGISGWEVGVIAAGMLLLGWLLWWILHVHEK